MRIAIGGVSHETNTFCAGKTELADFQRSAWQSGQGLLDAHTGVRSDLGGMIEAAARLGIEVAPTFYSSTQPYGTISREAFERLRDELIGGLRAVLPVDAVCLAMHGAGVAEGADDFEGALLREVRALVGPDVPIVVTLDLHGNITQRMVDNSNVLLGCHLYPHTDMYERGIEAVELAQRIVNGEIRPVTRLAHLSMLAQAAATAIHPARSINEHCAEWESGPGVVDATFFHGFPYTDTPDVGITVVVTTNGDEDLAERAAKDVARRVWELRDDFRQELPKPDEAIRQALDTDGGPVVIAETSDNPGGGAAGDGTHLLKAMLAANLSDAAFGFIYDVETVEQAHAAGVSSTIVARVGGKTDALHGAPADVTAYVKALTDGQFIMQSAMGRGRRVELGRTARLVVGGLDIIVASSRQQTFDPELFLLHGVDVSRYKIVALKSSQHFRAGFEPVAARIIRTDTPGATTNDFSLFPYERIPRPMWPFDEGAESRE
ncbi:MAG TPA: M81 family metallopeptidase [Thermomicrobiales bacterium]|nr:M81 family metallopeptidase [Thermomicrobiales bacterium]